jgi:hypothetical protein
MVRGSPFIPALIDLFEQPDIRIFPAVMRRPASGFESALPKPGVGRRMPNAAGRTPVTEAAAIRPDRPAGRPASSSDYPSAS